MSYDHTTGMHHYVCCHKGCSATICLSEDEDEKLRRTHEWFACPYGHSQQFTGKTKDEKRIEELERYRKRDARTIERFRELWETATDQRKLATDTLKTCPLGCGWKSRKQVQSWNEKRFAPGIQRVRADLFLHLADEHGIEVPESEEIEAAA